jgi:hypothetical protein
MGRHEQANQSQSARETVQSRGRISRRGLIKGLGAIPAGAVVPSSPPPAGTQSGQFRMPEIWVNLGAAQVKTTTDMLVVETGLVERSWRWTGKGLVTVSFQNLASSRQWASAKPAFSADWAYEGLITEDGPARLASLTAKPVRFDPFTSPHIEVVAEIHYPGSKLILQYVIGTYPNAPGLRTQLRVKAAPGFAAGNVAKQESPRSDYIPVRWECAARRAIGYYNHTQRRNLRETEILREEIRTGPLSGPENYNWASILCVEDDGEGFCVVKESHKCVNQQGVNTGDFQCDSRGLVNTGWGPAPQDILTERFRSCWASWAIAYDGGEEGRNLAIKVFDRHRYPVDPDRDIYIMANTWGSGAAKQESLEASREENILRQIESSKDLGIDVQQIDDGWQGDQYKTWTPVASRYPEGWKNVRSAARKAGVKLGLWAAWVIGPEDLRNTYNSGGFNYYKIDFAQLDTYDKLEGLMEKMRNLIRHSGHTVRVNWDVTENPARVGYYFARDLGNIYLENRKPMLPAQVVYVPYLVLRDAWQLARHANLNRFQITAQNIDRVNRETSNAHLHNHPYSVAITLMGSPIFFQETHYYTEEARNQIRPLLALYKRHREGMYRGYVFPIGEKPDDASWTGFQNHDLETGSGYLIVFRELNAPESSKQLRLKFVGGRTIRLLDLRSDLERVVAVPASGEVLFEIDAAPDFRFVRYEPV